jgi:hypothetical protein
MNELIGKKIHESFGGKWFEEIVEIVCYTETSLLVKVRADDGFEKYESFEKRNGDWYFDTYWFQYDRKTALYLFDLDCKKVVA